MAPLPFIDVIIQPHETVFVLCAGTVKRNVFSLKNVPYKPLGWAASIGCNKQEVFRITAHSPCHFGIVVIKHL